MKIVIIQGVMVMGTPVFPFQTTGTGKNEQKEPTVIDVDKAIAKELVMSKQAKKAPAGAKVNFEVKPLEKEDEDRELDEFFGDEDFDDDEDEDEE